MPATRRGLALLTLALVLGAAPTPLAPGQSKKEEAYRQRLAKLHDGDARAQYRLALWCLRVGLEERAKAHLEKVLALDPEHAGARRKLGFIRFRGKWVTATERAAIEYGEKLARLADDDARGHFALGLWCRRQGLLEPAAARFRAVLALEPKHPGAARELRRVEAALLEERVETYIEAGPAARPALLAALRRRDRLPLRDVGRWRRFIEARLHKKPRHRGQEVARTHHPRFPVKYRLLGRTRGKKLSLLVLLHGGGPSAEVNDRSWESFKRFRDTPFDLVAIPRVWDDSTGAGWVMESGPLAVVSVIEELKRAYPIDPDRIYLAGSSMGGYGTCWIGSLEADRFAALGIIAAGYSRGGARLANLLHTPVTCHIGELDTASDHVGTARELRDRLARQRTREPAGYEHVYKEYPGAGHSLGDGAYREVFKWMRRFKRDPAPRHVIWEPFTHRRYVTHKHYFYWLAIAHPRSGMRLEARISSPNRITIQTRSVPAFTVFVNDALVDVKSPVTVVVDGRPRFSATLRPSLTALLESLAAREDPAMVYPYRIDIDVGR